MQSSFIVTLGGMLCACYVLVSMLLGGGNTLAELYFFLMIGGFIFGVLSPSGCFRALLLVGGYVDLLKRLMVFDGRVDRADLYSVLGIPPLMLAGITTGLLLAVSVGRTSLGRMDLKNLAMCAVLLLAIVVLEGKSSGFSLHSIAPAIANSGLYVLMLFITPTIIRTKADVLRLLRFLIIGFLPVGLYGVYQQTVGFQDFEIEYLRSGLSIEIKQLAADEVRAFSTLNSPTALSIVAVTLCVGAMLLTSRFKTNNGMRPMLGVAMGAFCAIVYAGAWVASTSRSAGLIYPVVFLGWLCFQQARRTAVLYSILVGGFVSIVLASPFLLSQMYYLDAWSHEVSGGRGNFLDQLVRLGTFTDRLKGFSNLITQPEMWTWFGYGAEAPGGDDATFSHDFLSGVLVRYGAVALVIGIAIAALLLRQLHRLVYSIEDEECRSLAALLMGLPFGYFVVSALSGNILVVFPCNMMFWLIIGLVLSLQTRTSQAVAVKVDDVISPVPRGMGRFHPQI